MRIRELLFVWLPLFISAAVCDPTVPAPVLKPGHGVIAGYLHWDGEPKKGCKIFIDGWKDYTLTDENGDFAVGVPEGLHLVVAPGKYLKSWFSWYKAKFVYVAEGQIKFIPFDFWWWE